MSSIASMSAGFEFEVKKGTVLYSPLVFEETESGKKLVPLTYVNQLSGNEAYIEYRKYGVFKGRKIFATQLYTSEEEAMRYV